MMRRAPSSRGSQGPVGRVVDLDDDLAAGGSGEAQDLRADAAVGRPHAHAHEHRLESEAGRDGRVAGHQGVISVSREVDHLRPRVQQEAIPVQAPARLAVGLDAADALEGLHDHALELGDPDHAPALVSQRRQVAHLGDREQPLVAGVLARHAVEQVHVLGRGQALEGEVGKAPEPEALAHHRVQAAQDLVLDRAVAAKPEGEQVNGRHPPAAPGDRDAHHDPLDLGRPGDGGDRRAQLGGEGLVRAAAVLRVEVDGDRLAVGQAPGVLGAGAQFAGQHVVLGEGGHHMPAPALVLVVGGEQGVPVDDRLGELPAVPACGSSGGSWSPAARAGAPATPRACARSAAAPAGAGRPRAWRSARRDRRAPDPRPGRRRAPPWRRRPRRGRPG